MKKVTLLFFALLSALANANPPIGTHVTETLEPGKAEEFQSPLPWSVDVTCKVRAEDEEGTVEGKLISSEVKVNGKKYHSPDDVVMPVHTGDKFKVKAGKFIKVRVTNLSEHKLHFDCSL